MDLQTLRDVVRLPVQPVTAMGVLRLARDPDGSAAQLARYVELDPALSAAVLRLANAPHLGLGRRVGSARQAVVLLGSKSVGSLAATGTASLVFSEDDQIAPPGFWAHSLATAVGASLIARRLNAPVDDAFTAGLLHDIGATVLYRRDRLRYERASVPASGRTRSVVDAEEHEFHTSHNQVGARLLERWNLPERLVRAVRHHHVNPELVGDEFSRIIVVGHIVANAVTGAAGRETPPSLSEALAVAGLSLERPSALVAECERELVSIGAFLKAAG